MGAVNDLGAEESGVQLRLRVLRVMRFNIEQKSLPIFEHPEMLVSRGMLSIPRIIAVTRMDKRRALLVVISHLLFIDR